MKQTCFPTLLLSAIAFATALPSQMEDDRENDTPTGTYWNTGVSAAQIDTLTNEGWRLTNIEIEATSPYRFTVTMVPNSGAYAIGWWWYYGADAASISTALNQNNARLIDLEVVDNGSGSPRFTCIMVANTGANAKAWGWLYNASTTSITNLVNQGNRIVDLEEYTLGSTTYRACVVIRNSGADSRGWAYYYGVDQTTLGTLLTQNNARIYDLDRVGTNFNVVMIARGSQKIWHYYGQTAGGVTDLLSQIGGRAYDIQRYSTLLGTRFNVAIINNSNALSTRISEILRGTTDGHSGVYLKRANGSVLAYINGDRQHEPASTLKTLHHLQAMRAVQLNQTTLATNYTTYTAGGPDSCPGGTTTPVSESLESVLSQMMNRSDNNRTRTITTNFGGFSGLNSRASALGMDSTVVNHHIGCGTPANLTTLRDIAHLHERVVNGYLGDQREKFYEIMANGYEGGGYAEGALWPVMQSESSSLGLTSAQLAAFRSEFMIAAKKGGYGVAGLAYRCWGGFVRIPAYVNGGIQYREYMVGSFVAGASSEANAIDAAKFAAAEVLREELRSAMSTWRTYTAGTLVGYGSGCTGSQGVPTHDASGVPELGQSVRYSLGSARRISPAVMAFGTSNTSWNRIPLPIDLGILGAPGCAMRTNNLLSLGVTTTVLGGASITLPIPINTALIDFDYYTQFTVLDPTANAFGLVTTRGIRTTVGGRR